MTGLWSSALEQTMGLVTPSPSPSPAQPVVLIGDWSVPVSVFVGAVSGATLAVLSQLITTTLRNLRSYLFLRALLKEEVEDLTKKVAERRNHLDVMIPLYPALPTKAWDALVQSQQRRFMRDGTRKALSPLYREVAVANKHLELIPTALQVSQLAAEEVTRDAYRDETIRLLKDPLDRIEEFLPAARRALKITESGTTVARAAVGGGG